MSVIEQLKYLWHPADMVESLINEWVPKPGRSEKQYEASLYEYLHQKLRAIQITKQYALGKTYADLVVGDKIIVEIKLNLRTMNEYHRLIGQLSEYIEWGKFIIIVLIGDTDIHLKKRLNEHINKHFIGFSFDSDEIRVLQKHYLM